MGARAEGRRRRRGSDCDQESVLIVSNALSFERMNQVRRNWRGSERSREANTTCLLSSLHTDPSTMKYTTAFISVFLATATALAAPSDLSTGAQLRLKDIRTQGICPNFTVKCVLGKDWRNPVGNVSLSTVTEEEEGMGRGGDGELMSAESLDRREAFLQSRVQMQPV
jgi:hypothetical protein